MVDLSTIVWFVFVAIIVIGVLALLWWLIGYCESQLPMPMAWKIVRVVFVILCVFLLIAILMGLLGHPLVRVMLVARALSIRRLTHRWHDRVTP
jgi:hypothetical protein